MRRILGALAKFLVANLAVVAVIILLPVFLVTDQVSVFDQVMDYLFQVKI